MQTFFIKRLAAPKEQTNTIFQSVVADNRITIQKPHRTPVPYFAFSAWQGRINFSFQYRAYQPVALRLPAIVGNDGFVCSFHEMVIVPVVISASFFDRIPGNTSDKEL